MWKYKVEEQKLSWASVERIEQYILCLLLNEIYYTCMLLVYYRHDFARF